jgi:hypothetical protein
MPPKITFSAKSTDSLPVLLSRYFKRPEILALLEFQEFPVRQHRFPYGDFVPYGGSLQKLGPHLRINSR